MGWWGFAKREQFGIAATRERSHYAVRGEDGEVLCRRRVDAGPPRRRIEVCDVGEEVSIGREALLDLVRFLFCYFSPLTGRSTGHDFGVGVPERERPNLTPGANATPGILRL